MKPARLCALLIMTALLCACVTPLIPGCTRFGRSGQVCLLPPAALPQLDAVHLVSVTHQGRTDTFLGQLHIDPKALRLAGSSLFGTGLFTLSYDGQELRVEPETKDLPADKLVVMLELALVDPAQLRPRLHGLALTVQDIPKGQVREITESGRLITRVVRGNGPLKEADVSIDIPPLGLSVKMTAADKPQP
jgi:hypothetical protein